ncbi:MAG TPA: alpha/beta hydrolase fold domain-containing protein [Polyangia bacterium]|nr:alpha/beta hydrolase fold domain-containing protein [Polyangia bacterium]
MARSPVRGVKRRIGATVRRARVKAGAFVVDNLFRGLAMAGRLHPEANPARHGIEVVRDLAYREGGAVEHLLDIWRPTSARAPLPIVFYVHGGGFRFLSKDTHWIMALAFARAGYLVFNVSYRLAPKHPFPAAVEDIAEAWQYMLRHAAAHGGDLSRVVVAGESAGANLAMGLTLSACYRRAEPHARAVFDAGVVPRACLPMCGMLQVSDPARFARRKKLPRFIADRIDEVAEAYLFGHDHATPEELELADPLRVLERGDRPARPLPPFFAAVGTADPVLDDTRRLEAALGKAGVPHEVRYYPKEPHAFHALVFRKPARACWAATFRFLERVLRDG